MGKISKKKARKLLYKKCFFCGCDDINLLDNHRIAYEKEINKYVDFNMLLVCANCHRKIHSHQIIIEKKYNSTGGIIVHYFENEKEYWKKETI